MNHRTNDRSWTGRFFACLVAAVAAVSAACPEDDARGSLDECDAVAQDCGEATQRCILVDGGSAGPYTRCWSFYGSQAERETCGRIDDEVGYDTCAAGLHCTSLNMPRSYPQQLQCLPYCHAHGDCDAGSLCLPLAGSDTTGVCALTCALFEDGCGAGQACYRATTFGDGRAPVCAPAGDGLSWAACVDSGDCAPFHSCTVFSDGLFCFPACDDAHPCASAVACTPYTNGGETHYGYCRS
ncbi:MAG: hypothetical protein HY907_23030 [Deltaproteobacteria bacterium]|nr:hypothetical protein [Deltaproteobacteria bacterium]